jgi:uncharacterized protein (TIGR00730 family)
MTTGTRPATRTLRRIAVFCGSNFGKGPAFSVAAANLGKELAGRGIELVYGGTHKGLMGVLADAVLDNGGYAHGVITQRLHDKGHLHAGLQVKEIVADMRIRKERMLDLANACIALPGGLGTVEEFMEAWTLNQLGDVDKPVGLLNVEGYYDPLVAMVDKMIAERFLPEAHRESFVVASGPADLVDRLSHQSAITTAKWM